MRTSDFLYGRNFAHARHDMLEYAFEVEHANSHLSRMIVELERRGLLDSTPSSS